jgi:poly(hydroxyalkanoate) depolymerase family esterase
MDQHRMAEATRLTREGRLNEAMAMLTSGQKGLTRTTMPELPSLSPQLPGLPGLRGASRPASTAPGRFLDRVHRCASGERAYKIYVPTGYAGEPVPLVVMLHGGTQNADDFAAGTGMNELAEQHRFLVVYPEQSRTANPMGYWNWFQPDDQRRGSGEPAIIAGITAEVAQSYAVDQNNVGLAGFSAGGAMAAVVAAAYPEVFTAVGVHSGLAAGAAHDVPSAFAAMGAGVPSPVRTSVPLIVFHGDADPTVAPANADCLVRADAPATGRPPVVATHQVPGGHRYTTTVHLDDDGRPMVEQWTVHGAAHAWSGGRPTGTYTDPQGPDASAELVRFFARHARCGPPAGTGPAGR